MQCRITNIQNPFIGRSSMPNTTYCRSSGNALIHWYFSTLVLSMNKGSMVAGKHYEGKKIKVLTMGQNWLSHKYIMVSIEAYQFTCERQNVHEIMYISWRRNNLRPQFDVEKRGERTFILRHLFPPARIHLRRGK